MTKMLADKKWPEGLCGDRLTNFVCSLYSPVCLDGYEYSVPPCRRMCRKVKEACNSTSADGLKWPEEWDCEQYPNTNSGRYESGSQICADWTDGGRLFFRYFDKW